MYSYLRHSLHFVFLGHHPTEPGGGVWVGILELDRIVCDSMSLGMSHMGIMTFNEARFIAPNDFSMYFIYAIEPAISHRHDHYTTSLSILSISLANISASASISSILLGGRPSLSTVGNFGLGILSPSFPSPNARLRSPSSPSNRP